MGSINFDMDGVLAKYVKEDYKTSPMRHEIPGDHYFQHREPDVRVCKALSILATAQTTEPDFNTKIHIISKLSSDGHLFVEQAIDKARWLDENCIIYRGPYHLNRFVPVCKTATNDEKPKRMQVVLNRSLHVGDILVDDLNDNLDNWQFYGDTSVKYLNGINSAGSWKGPTITPEMTAEEIVFMLASMVGETKIAEKYASIIQQMHNNIRKEADTHG